MATKTASEAVKYLAKILPNTILMQDAGKPNGGIYKFSRPQNSTKEDVVINILGLTRDAVQEGLLVINIFVPNRVAYDEVTDTTDLSLPDTARIDYLNTLADQALKQIWEVNGDYVYEFQQDTILEDENNQHFISIRVEFNSQSLN